MCVGMNWSAVKGTVDLSCDGISLSISYNLLEIRIFTLLGVFRLYACFFAGRNIHY